MMRLSKSNWTIVGIGAAMLLISAIIGFLKSSHRIKEITINASIDPNYSYFVSVTYVSTVDNFFCTSYSLFVGRRTGLLKELEYRPKEDSGRQVVSFPINELSPFFGCKWLPRYASLYVQDNSNPRRNGSGKLFDVRESGNMSPGIVISENSSSVDKPIRFSCRDTQFVELRLSCDYVLPPPPPGKNKLFYAGSNLLVFPGVPGNHFPFDREDVYWLDISFEAKEEERTKK